MANGNKAALQHQVLRVARGDIFQANAGHAAGVAQHLIERVEGLEFNLARRHFLHHLVDQNRLGFEFIAAMHQVHLAGNVGQVKGLFHGRIAAANHADDLVAVEKAVAGGATRHATSHERSLRRQSQVFG